MNSDKKKTVLLIGVTILTLGLGVVAVVTALKLRQLEPVAPTAPTSRPAAQEFYQTDPEACIEPFTVNQNVCDGWCDSNDDCSTGYCYKLPVLDENGNTVLDASGNPVLEDEGVCRNSACEDEPSCECAQHTVCNDELQICETVDGVGENECNLYEADCVTPVHTECVDYSCVEVVGEGNSECRLDADDCLVTHTKCVNEACVEVVGEGISECELGNDAVCQPNEDTHLECVDSDSNGEADTCAEVVGAGDDTCADNVDCLPNERLICRDNACVTVAGEGENECAIDKDCETPTHLECVDNSGDGMADTCQTVTGGGADRCADDNDCRVAVQNTPTPSPTTPPNSPSVTPMPEATPIPTVPPVELPQAGVVTPTLTVLTAGALMLLVGLAGVIVW